MPVRRHLSSRHPDSADAAGHDLGPADHRFLAPGGDDPSFEEVHAALSVPSIPPGNGGSAPLGRRRFLQAMLVGGGATAITAGPFARYATALAPLGTTDGILVVVMLGGGNDGLNTVIPVTDPAYGNLRRQVSVATGALPLGSSGLALHPRLTGLKARYDAGKVAVVRGVGKADGDLSHFSSMASWMAGTAGASRSTGWLGRYLDGLGDAATEMRAVNIGNSVPLHLIGSRPAVTGLPVQRSPFGADRDEAWEVALYNAVADFGSAASGRGVMGDAIGAVDRNAMAAATTVDPLYQGITAPPGELTPQLALAARLVNLDVGVKVIGVTLGGFDTHDSQLYKHGELLGDLDAAITEFYRTLQAKWADQVTLMTFSEFGRRAGENGGRGTDHGTSSAMFVIGDNVKGGLYGTQPSLTSLDSRGNLGVHVDFRSVYRSVLTGWLGADATTILGGTYPDLGLFRSTPGTVPPVVLPPVDPRWLPYPSVTRLVEQQYLDFLGRPGDASGIGYWSGLLTSGALTVASVIQRFLDSAEFGAVVGPAVRVALAGTGTPPGYGQLLGWIAALRARQPLTVVAADVVASPGWAARFASRSTTDVVTVLYRDTLGTTVAAAVRDQWVADVDARRRSFADYLVFVADSAANEVRAKPVVDVCTIYAGMLRRAPDAAGLAYWVDLVRQGRTIQTLIINFFLSAEYRRRFT